MAARIEDAGKKIGGARKDWRAAHMTSSDVAMMTVEEKAELIKKDNVWPKPDYEKLVAEGMPAIVAASVKIIRDRIAATPSLKGSPTQEAGREAYVVMLGALRDELLGCRSQEDVVAVYTKLADSLGGETHIRRDAATRAVWYSIYKGKYSPIRFDSGDHVKAREMVNTGFPSDKVPVWQKNVKFYKTSDGRVAGYKSGRPFGTFADQQSAFDFLLRQHEAALLKKKSGPPKPKLPPERPHLDEIRREGMTDHRRGLDMTPERFIDVFGFLGVEFGNWVPNDERQRMLNLGFDGMMDLAEIMDWNERDMSLGNRLSAAFGARGQGGRAAAHYEPGQAVFNFTRFSGAGSLAHEFAHGLDHLLGIGTSILSLSGVPSATGWQHPLPGRPSLALAHRGKEIASTWDAVIQALSSSPVGKEEAVAIQRRFVGDFERAIDAQVLREAEAREEGRLHEARSISKVIATNTERMMAQQQRLERLIAKPSYEDFGRTQTSFLAEAIRCSGKGGYEAEPTELFARSFESYIFDELEARGALSEYLVHGVEEDRYADREVWKGNKYPTGAERQNFNLLYKAAVKATVPMMEELRDNQPAALLGR